MDERQDSSPTGRTSSRFGTPLAVGASVVFSMLLLEVVEGPDLLAVPLCTALLVAAPLCLFRVLYRGRGGTYYRGFCVGALVVCLFGAFLASALCYRMLFHFDSEVYVRSNILVPGPLERVARVLRHSATSTALLAPLFGALCGAFWCAFRWGVALADAVTARDLQQNIGPCADEPAPSPEWRCGNCGETNPGTFEVCWNCSIPRNTD